jgi:hypothetical protein
VLETGAHVEPGAPAPRAVAEGPAGDPTVEKARELRLLAGAIRRKGGAAQRIDELHEHAACLLLGHPLPLAAVTITPRPSEPAPDPVIPAPALAIEGQPAPDAKAEIARLVPLWWAAFGDILVGAKGLLPLVDAHGVLAHELRGHTGHGRVTKLGDILREYVDYTSGGFTIVRRKSGDYGYQLVKAN